ncbi:hypothetical protein SLEP1_g46356 [Rubroshorea leprosula]|uniref:Uncharacterized protein n=1 Tax=Rubroshorea leprosula TaxID=152421 RepID=A0AAV5LMM4_9ROSI|nr:hypothetical protein SLEP1_g46356 [Rubroshorea leprosula]
MGTMKVSVLLTFTIKYLRGPILISRLWPHLNELLQCYTSDWVKDESKYGIMKVNEPCKCKANQG